MNHRGPYKIGASSNIYLHYRLIELFNIYIELHINHITHHQQVTCAATWHTRSAIDVCCHLCRHSLIKPLKDFRKSLPYLSCRLFLTVFASNPTLVLIHIELVQSELSKAKREIEEWPAVQSLIISNDRTRTGFTPGRSQ